MVIKVLLAEDDEGVRRTEKSILDVEPEIEVVGETAVAPHAIQLVRTLKPHVVVMDLNMSGNQGVATRQVKLENPAIRVLAVTAIGRHAIKSFIGAFGADELLDEGELDTKLIATIKLIAFSAK
jgi:DNA-binding NarL/FixJ family response regulator